MALHYSSGLSRLDVNSEMLPVFTRHRLSARGGTKRRNQSYHRLRTSSQKHSDHLKHQVALWLAYSSILNSSTNVYGTLWPKSSKLQTPSQPPRKSTTSQRKSKFSQLRRPYQQHNPNQSSNEQSNTAKDQRSQKSTPPPSSTNEAMGPQYEDFIQINAPANLSSSSDLSSPPSQIGSTPEGLLDLPDSSHDVRQDRMARDGSPVRRSKRTKRATTFYRDVQNETFTDPPTKRRKLSNCSSGSSPSGVKESNSARPSRATRTPQGVRHDEESVDASHVAFCDYSLRDESMNATNAQAPSSSCPRLQAQQQSGDSKIQEAQPVVESYARAEPLPAARSIGIEQPQRHKQMDPKPFEKDMTNAFCAKVHYEQYERQIDDAELETFFFSQQEDFDMSDRNHEEWKDKTLYPMFDKNNPIYYAADAVTRYKGPVGVQHGSNHDSEAPSPPRRGKGGRGRGGFGGWRGRGRGRGGTNAGGGRDRGDSPDPPQKANLTPEDKLTLSHIRTRQAELKKFFALVGSQQAEILNSLAARDLSKMVRKSKAHTKVPEFDEICEVIDDMKDDACELAQRRYEFERHLAEGEYYREVKIADSNFRTRVEESQQEHIKGAEGDLIIFKNAHNAANDDTRTEAGSDVECYFPRYHECPEPDTTVRGYTSTRIKDEKSLKQHLATYDEQAQREVIDDDVFAPLVKSIAYENAERKKAEDKEKTQTFDELINVAEDELKKSGGYLIPRSTYPSENPQFALSRLADASEYVSRAHPEQSYIFMPITPADAPQVAQDMARNDAPPSQLPAPPPARNVVPPPPQPKRSTSKKQRLGSDPSKRPVRPIEQNGTSTPASNQLPAIAPAPMRLPPPPPSPIYPPPPPQHMPYSLPPPPAMVSASPQHSRRSSQQFTFTPTQTPGQSYFAPSATPAPIPNGNTRQNKMHNTFVNQTIESRLQADAARENAARTQGQGAGPKGGKRILLPKV